MHRCHAVRRLPARHRPPCPTATQLQIGQMEIKAYEDLKAKIAVQLTQDTALGRTCGKRWRARCCGNGSDRWQRDAWTWATDRWEAVVPAARRSTPSFGSPGDNPRPSILGNSGLRNDGTRRHVRRPALSLTLYAIDTGKVVWATASCSTTGGMVNRQARR